MRKITIILILTTISISSYCQSAWPSVTWANATNLSGILPSSLVELSGLYWNNDTKRLLAVGDVGYFTALQYNATSGQFTRIGSVKNSDGPEGITQVNTNTNEFYTIDENSYEIRKYSYNDTFTTITKLKSWNLLASPSPMTDTGNSGPEGICFVPDSYLQKTGFISSATGLAYASKKGMGGLLFLAHQDGGYVWVYDVNPAVNNDFAFVGKYLTNRSESCDLAFDNSTGLMYILHNTDNNTLEVTDLKTTVSGGIYAFHKLKEYYVSNPSSGSDNIEGFAIAPKFPISESLGAWLCRDVTKTTEVADALKWFKPFTADGDLQTGIDITTSNLDENFQVHFNKNTLTLSEQKMSENCYSTEIYSTQGKLIYSIRNTVFPLNISVSKIPAGIYLIRISTRDKQAHLLKFII